MDTSTSIGKVKVEYSDPYGVYQLVASDLESRLPLQNLNWTSATRPTRSIDSLYVDIVPDEKSASVANLKRSVVDGETVETPTSPSASGEFSRIDGQYGKRERRHQIPGLRRTPYLKIYFLRCDDSETYKATARRTIREWIKANSSPSQAGSTSSQEHHDAFECMIVHVVLPDVQTGASWPNKASASVLEKLKSDFNSSSRNSLDRIVQIPSTKSLQVQGVTVNPVPTGVAKDAFLQESNLAWDDLIARMKLLILNSFDNRVKQYEEDIKEKGNQRSLPGWNFCTFFVLKEGLARGFESVGLVDDALMGYDELALELMSAIRNENDKGSRLFREHTQELLIQAETALQGQDLSATRSGNKRLSTSVLAIDNKPYRELILANNISIFDFRSYVFARQIQLLLRLASVSGKALRANSSAVDLTSSRDPVILADICWRAKEFFADIARVIRLDLKACFRADANANEKELKARFTVAENLIASWTYKGAMDILSKTREANLPDVGVTDHEDDRASNSGLSPTESLPRPGSPVSDARSRSLDVVLSPTGNQILSPTSLRPKGRLSLDAVRSQTTPEATSFSSGAISLAAERAELYLIARRALGSAGERQGWRTTWPTADDAESASELDEISLAGSTAPDAEKSKKGRQESEMSTAGVLDSSMRVAMADKVSFYKHWEELSLLAFLLFEVTKVRKSIYLITADIAAVRVRLGDYAYAAPFLKELAPGYTANQWHNLEIAVLDMYVFCLQKLNQFEDFVPAALQMLAKAAKMSKLSLLPPIVTSQIKSTPFSHVNLDSIVEASTFLAKPVQVALDDYFSEIRTEGFIVHSPRSDEYGVHLHFNSRLSSEIDIETVTVKITGMTAGTNKEILFSSATKFRCIRGHNTILISSKMMHPDLYTIDSITFVAGQIKFFQSYKSISFQDRNLQNDKRTPRLLIWPATRACMLEVVTHDTIQLEHPRALVFKLASNDNSISHAKLVVKSGTAGLRLHTSDAEILAGDCSITSDRQPSTVPLSAISPSTVIQVKIPYRVEGDMTKVNVRTELTYQVDGETYTYCNSHQLDIQLPLGVNVQDIFKKTSLFSKFSISTSSETPIRLLDCKLNGNDFYRVSTPHFDNEGLVVFPKQPVSLVYQINKIDEQALSAKPTKLSLQIDYQCLDEQVLETISHHMAVSLESSQFEGHLPLLRSHLRSVLKDDTKQHDLERVGLLGQVTLPTYDQMSWHRILTMLRSETQENLSSWLRKWHEDNIVMDIERDSKEVNRHIEIPVEIPMLPILHTALLAIERRSKSNPYSVGELIQGELQISHTRYWSTPDKKLAQSMSFIYELETSSDTWLIAGQRRGYYTAVEGELKTFPILLLPLRAGKIMLPVVEIRIAKENDTDEMTACETDYQSLGTAIEIVPGVTGVSLDIVTNSLGGLDGEVKVLEVEREGVSV